MTILESINWSETSFDVLCVETEVNMRVQGYHKKVAAYLTEKGYNLHEQKGRNSCGWRREEEGCVV